MKTNFEPSPAFSLGCRAAANRRHVTSSTP